MSDLWKNMQDQSIRQSQPNPLAETVFAVLFFAAITIGMMAWLLE